jgi:thiol-disulfide isomerase/thioredoxin
MEPTVLALKNKFSGQVEFIVADVDDSQGQQLASRYGVNSIPAFFILDGKGNPVYQGVGVVEQDVLVEKIKAARQK